jgi:hypothetical protein
MTKKDLHHLKAVPGGEPNAAALERIPGPLQPTAGQAASLDALPPGAIVTPKSDHAHPA